jgi:4-hydroxy-tetrahydrodipicolinate reductase
VINIAVSGIRGRMGRTLVELARGAEDLRVGVGLDRGRRGGGAADVDTPDGVRIGSATDGGALLADVDVVIDFSTPGATRELVETAADALAGRALVVGTTGLDETTNRLLDELTGRTAVLTAANFSIGVNLLLGVCERFGATLPADAYDVEIVEAHHSRKVDAPSGTALALGSAIAAGRGTDLADTRRDGRSGDTGARPVGQIGLHALRGGGVTGEHRVLFFGARETIELRHEALDRALFAEGALRAARWISGRAPGRYTMRDVLDI